MDTRHCAPKILVRSDRPPSRWFSIFFIPGISLVGIGWNARDGIGQEALRLFDDSPGQLGGHLCSSVWSVWSAPQVSSAMPVHRFFVRPQFRFPPFDSSAAGSNRVRTRPDGSQNTAAKEDNCRKVHEISIGQKIIQEID